MKNWFKVWIVPGAVFQSVIVGGGYGTGREVVEFISGYGPIGGMAIVLLVGLLMSVTLAVTFEFARIFKAIDYRNFFKALLGPLWVSYEIIFILTLLLVLAVAGSAAGSILHDSFNLPANAGIAIMLIIVVILNYFGREWVEKTLTVWGLLMSLVLIVFVILTFSVKGNAIFEQFSTDKYSHLLTNGWLTSGFKFFLYNILLAPVILYATDSISTRKEAIGAGAIAGFLGVFPGLAFHLAFMAGYPEILSQDLPTYWMIQQIGIPFILIVYVIVLFGTIAQTGVGILQGINERLDAWCLEQFKYRLSAKVHAIIAASTVLMSMLLANVGIVSLVAKGYGLLAWFSLGIFVLPILTVGLWKIIKVQTK